MHALHRRLPSARCPCSSPCRRGGSWRLSNAGIGALSGRWPLPGILAYIFIGLVLLARATNHWQTNMPRAVYMDLVPHANELSHPGM